jgi:hypothetical protein
MRERIGNLIWVIDFIDVFYVVTRSLVEKVFGTWSNLPGGPLLVYLAVIFF